MTYQTHKIISIIDRKHRLQTYQEISYMDLLHKLNQSHFITWMVSIQKKKSTWMHKNLYMFDNQITDQNIKHDK